MDSERSTPRAWSGARILGAAAIVLGVWIALHFLWIVRPILIAGFLGLLVGIVLSRATDWLEQRGIRRSIGAASIVLLALGLLVGLGFAIGPMLKEQTRELRTRIPSLLGEVEKRTGVSVEQISAEVASNAGVEAGGVLTSEGGDADGQDTPPGAGPQEEPRERASQDREAPRESDPAPRGGSSDALRQMATQNLDHLRSILFPVATAAVDAITAVIIIIFVALFLAMSPHLYRDGFLRMIPQAKRKRAAEVLGKLGDTLRQWMLARLTVMAIVGVLSGAVLAGLGVSGWLALGVIAGLLEFIPFFGPVVSGLLATGMALVDSPQKAVWTAIAFVAIQQLEGNVLTPFFLKKRVHIPPALTILTVPALMLVFGFSGALIAEPLLAVAMVLVQELWVKRQDV
ncbi:MAG TPA: AI-2E family transporter [Thermoanaerobaculia bacterium]|nr:AI-2E family transporter [Thermoanaerobaculia bacterium]